MNDGKVSFRQHLNELRRRLIYSVLFLAIATAAAFAFHQDILRLLMEPAEGFAGIPNQKPIYTELTEFIGIAFKVSLVTGFVVSLPFTLFPDRAVCGARVDSGRGGAICTRCCRSACSSSSRAPLSATACSSPPAVRFLLGFSGDIAEPLITIGSYANLMMTLLFWMGLIFETPVVMVSSWPGSGSSLHRCWRRTGGSR